MTFSRAAVLMALSAVLLFAPPSRAQQQHRDHPAPEKLGSVSFSTSCSAAVQPRFERSVALLHSFAYFAAQQSFEEVAQADPQCAMAHWGIAMSYFHQLWEPPVIPAGQARSQSELALARDLATTDRERRFIEALSVFYNSTGSASVRIKAYAYADAMAALAHKYPADVEAQVFYALALLAAASPSDKTHANQKAAVAILSPLYQQHPDHPGLAHYLIHADDNAELAAQGLPAARAYAHIAPSAPHALHMPSHIFTRLGLWDDSIASNQAARAAAHQQGDIGEELHAMDYLTYAYLQRGRDSDAAHVLDDLRAMEHLNVGDFKSGYAATAMPVRYAVERKKWDDAARIVPLDAAPPHVVAIIYWARALGRARAAQAGDASSDIAHLKDCMDRLNAAGNSYWATQVHIQVLEAQAWNSLAHNAAEEAVSLMRSAADEEDAVEKLPVTPGPVVPAREQLGEMLLALNRASPALAEFEASLKLAPGRRNALMGAASSADLVGDTKKAQTFRAALGQ